MCFFFLAVHCSECILFVEDFSVTKIPVSNGQRFYVSSPKVVAGVKGSSGNLTTVVQEEKTGAKDRFRRLMKDLVIGEIKPK